QLRSRIGQVHSRRQEPFRLRAHVPCGREGEGLHLPPVPEALNRPCLRYRVCWFSVNGELSSPLASIQTFSAGQFGRERRCSGGEWLKASAEAATGFNKEIRLP